MTKASRDLARFGGRGEWVRAFPCTVKGARLVRVQWLERGKKRETQSWPDTKENRVHAKAYAKGAWERISAGTNPRESQMSLIEMWQAYVPGNPHLRPRTVEKYGEDFDRWMLAFGESFLVARTTARMPGEFRAMLTAQGLGINTIRHTIGTVKTVYRWAEVAELIDRNAIALYRFKLGKDQRIESPAEYSHDEGERLLAQLDPTKASQWRAFVGLSLCAYQGARQNAVLHLQVPADVVSLHGKHPRIIWRKAWDKTGREWSQPLRAASIRAIEIALEWHKRIGYTGPWLLPPAQATRNKGETYDQQSLWWALREAEKRAGIAHIRGRGAHGLRRLLAGDVAELTGDPLLAMRSIGDVDVTQAERYIKTRDTRVEDVFRQLDESAENAKARSGEGSEDRPNAQSTGNPVQSKEPK